jgi:squalene-hopene/tetraprenyl-beta-curcumene cyclase
LGLPSTIEETALAVQALAGEEGSAGGVERGVGWLTEAVEAGAQDAATPLGLYFARLWYYERLYPVIFAAGALGRSREHSPTSAPEPSSSPPHFPAA